MSIRDKEWFQQATKLAYHKLGLTSPSFYDTCSVVNAWIFKYSNSATIQVLVIKDARLRCRDANTLSTRDAFLASHSSV